jgi:NitT/TauT family transport system permease protein
MQIQYKTRVRLVGVAILIAFLAAVQYAATSGMLPPTELVPVTEMVSTLIDQVSSGDIRPDFFDTAYRVSVAFIAATVVGIPTGWLLWKNETLWRILDPFLIVLYATPIFVFYPLLIVYFGLGQLPIILIAFAMSITAIVISTANGLDKVPEIYFNVGRSLDLSTLQFISRVQLPAAVPYIFTGLKLGFIYAFIGVIASEFILANTGLGYLVSLHYDRWETAEMYGAIIAIILLAIFVNSIVMYVENRLYSRSVRQ